MSDMKTTSIIVKSKSRNEMRDFGQNLILRDRELLVETEGEGDTFVARFKIGDGKTPYSNLEYVSSLYKLLPNFTLFDNNYTMCININLKNEE